MNILFVKKNHYTQAFTIIELLVIVAVIGILASISLVGYNAYQNNAKARQYETDATAIIKKAESIASEGIGNSAYPQAKGDFPSTGSVHKLPAGVGVVFTSAASSAITNTVQDHSSEPNDGAITSALGRISGSNDRMYTVKACGAGAGIIVFYPNPENSSQDNAAVKRLTSGITTDC